MSKELKTKAELEALVQERMRDAVIWHLEVRAEPVYGWSAFVIAAPEVVGDYQAQADRIAGDLRSAFDLKKL